MAGEKHCHIWALEARAENAVAVMEDVPIPREYLHRTTANRVRNRVIAGGARPQPARVGEWRGAHAVAGEERTYQAARSRAAIRWTYQTARIPQPGMRTPAAAKKNP